VLDGLKVERVASMGHLRERSEAKLPEIIHIGFAERTVWVELVGRRLEELFAENA